MATERLISSDRGVANYATLNDPYFLAEMASVQGYESLALDLYAQDPCAESWAGRARIFERNRNFVEAERSYREAIGLYPAFVEAWIALGGILARKSAPADVDEAVECYLHALSIDEVCPEAHFDLARVYDKIGNGRKALEHFERYLLYREHDSDDEYIHRLAEAAVLRLSRQYSHQ